MTTATTVRELLEADRRCLDAAELFLDALNDHPSPVGFERLEGVLRGARESADAVRAESAFETLLVRHLRCGWNVIDTVARYRYTWPRVPVARLVEALAGPTAISRLESWVASIDHDQVWSYLESRHRYRAGRVPVGVPGARALVEEVAGHMTTAFRDWLERRGWDLAGLDAEVIVGPDDSPDSWYHPQSHRVVLGGSEFMVFARDGHLTVNPVTALHALTHELAGHAVQNALSRELPDPLRPDDRSRLRFATLPLAEGFSAHATSLAVAFARDEGEAFGIEPADVDLLERMIELTPMHHAVPALASILAARGRQEPGFDAAAYLEQLCGHEGFGEMLQGAAAQPVYKIVYECACFFGLEEVRRVGADLEAQGVAEGDALRAMGRGAWALDCYRDAVLASRNARQNGA